MQYNMTFSIHTHMHWQVHWCWLHHPLARARTRSGAAMLASGPCWCLNLPFQSCEEKTEYQISALDKLASRLSDCWMTQTCVSTCQWLGNAMAQARHRFSSGPDGANDSDGIWLNQMIDNSRTVCTAQLARVSSYQQLTDCIQADP